MSGPRDHADDLFDDGPDDLSLDLALGALGEMLADARADDAVAERRRAAWLRRQAEAETTAREVLADLAERGAPVALDVVNGRRHRGRLVAVGDEAVELETATGRVVVVPDAVAAVRTAPDTAPAGAPLDASGSGRRTSRSLTALLAELAADEERVVVVGRNGLTTSGVLVLAARDVLGVLAAPGELVYVPVASVAEVSLPESG